MSSATNTFTSLTYESLAYATSTNSSYKLTKSNLKTVITTTTTRTTSTTATSFSTPANRRQIPYSRLSKKDDQSRLMFINYNRNDLNQTIFEPKHSSTPFKKEQKTSTPNRINESKLRNHMTFQQLSKVNAHTNNNKDFYYLTSSSTRYLDTENCCDYLTSRLDSNKLVSTSTPKSTPKYKFKLTETRTFKKPINANDMNNGRTLLNSRNDVSTVTTVIKCCIKPFRNFIKNNKNIKKLIF